MSKGENKLTTNSYKWHDLHLPSFTQIGEQGSERITSQIVHLDTKCEIRLGYDCSQNVRKFVSQIKPYCH